MSPGGEGTAPLAVLGAGGYLGSTFARFLAARGDPVLLGLRPRPGALHATGAEGPGAVRVVYQRLDLRSLSPLLEAASVVVNFIGVVELQVHGRRLAELVALNGFLPGLLAAWLGEMGRGDEVLVVHPSSQRARLAAEDPRAVEWVSRAFERFVEHELRMLHRPRPIGEATRCAARLLVDRPLPRGACPYGVSKLLGERCSALFPRHCIARISSVYGPSREARGLVQRLVEARLDGRRIEEAVEIRDLLYEADLHEIFRAIAAAPANGFPARLDVVSGARVATTDLVREIVELTPGAGGAVDLLGVPQPSPEPDQRAAAALLGRPFVSLREGLCRTVAAARSRQERRRRMGQGERA